MPRPFTLTELQRTCEAILDKRLDKSAFRRRLQGTNELVEVPGEFVRGSQRPGQVYEVGAGL